MPYKWHSNCMIEIWVITSASQTCSLPVCIQILHDNILYTMQIYVQQLKLYFRSSCYTNSYIYAVPQPPPSPKPHLLVLNATTIQLSWLPPFSWAEYPIVNYSVQVYNGATGEVINLFINATSEMVSTTAPVTFNYDTPQGGVMQNCEELVFIVSAASTIGWGSPAIVTGGIPIGIVCVYTLHTGAVFFSTVNACQNMHTSYLLYLH